MDYLCKCTKCDIIIRDENPSEDQRLYTSNEMCAVNYEFESPLRVQDESDSTKTVVVCPECESNGHLEPLDEDLPIALNIVNREAQITAEQVIEELIKPKHVEALKGFLSDRFRQDEWLLNCYRGFLSKDILGEEEIN